jgi:hypothetical protein
MGVGFLDGPWGGLLVIAMMTLLACAFLGCVLYQNEVGRTCRRLARRIAPPPETPSGPPIELIAGNARRLRAEMATIPTGTPMARRVGLASAYDDVLADACRALGVPDTFSGLPPGFRRDTERLHVEHELEQVGLRLTA